MEPGRILGNYRIDGVRGRGGMGVVYEATQMPVRRPVALKLLAADVSADDGFRARFRHEGLMQASLDHPNIVTLFEAGELEGHLFLAMQLVRGPTLRHLISNGLDPARALRLLVPVADALDCAHAAGLIHRDVKPQNILVGPGDHPYLADFGLTKTPTATTFTRTGQFVGSVNYSAPEQIRGDAVCAQTDVYALGAVLFEALTGFVPFRRDNAVSVLYAHMTVEPPRVSDQRPDLPVALDDVIAAALAKAPQDRPASASELLHSAERALGVGADATSKAALAAPARGQRTHATAGSSGSAHAPAAPRGLRRRRPTASVAIAALLMFIGAASYAGGLSTSGSEAKATSTALAPVAGIRVDAPAGWIRKTAPKLPGLVFGKTIAIGPSDGSGQGLVAGIVADATGPDLLPAALTRRLSAPTPKGEPVALGRLAALRYRRLRVRGSDLVVTVYAVPTSNGSAVVACYAPAAPSPGTGSPAACEGAATTLRVADRVYGLGPDPSYAAKLRPVLAKLDIDRQSLRARLADARGRAGQASVARRLSRASGRAMRALQAITPGALDHDAHVRLTRALAASRDGYARMSSAARDGRSARFESAARAVLRADADVRLALGSLRRLGYEN